MKKCPECGQGPMLLSRIFDAKPLGTFSLAGAQMKVSAQEKAKMECAACGAYAVGLVEDAVYDEAAGQYTAGSFTVERIVRPGDES